MPRSTVKRRLSWPIRLRNAGACGGSYGGSQTTDGNAAVGSNTVSSRVYGVVAGADYRFSPYTLAGFALAGGGTNFSVANSGTGRTDLFQAGAYLRHNVGPAYLSAALAYGWQDISTDRTVTVAGIDQLRAQFNAKCVVGPSRRRLPLCRAGDWADALCCRTVHNVPAAELRRGDGIRRCPVRRWS